MRMRKKILIGLALLTFAFTFSVPTAEAKGGEYKAVVKHLKTKYQAKKVRVPFMWLARFAVKVARPAGVKSFNVTLFEDLKFSRETLDEEMQMALRNSFTEEWSPILRIRSRTGEQVYAYMREAGKNVKITLVTIDKQDAAVIRATFSPERLADFINNPKIFGILLNDERKPTAGEQNLKVKDDALSQENQEEQKEF
jgi:hypothetical protein